MEFVHSRLTIRIQDPTCVLFLFMQVCWNFISHMLTNLGPLPFEQIHMMLGTFGVQENPSIRINELKTLLDRKATEHKLIYVNGLYNLP